MKPATGSGAFFTRGCFFFVPVFCYSSCMGKVLRCLVVLVGLSAVLLTSCRKETEEFDFTAAPAEESRASLFTLERDGNLRDFPAGEQGALGRLPLLFYRGEFYVKLMAYSESEAMDETLKTVAAGIDKRIRERKGR